MEIKQDKKDKRSKIDFNYLTEDVRKRITSNGGYYYPDEYNKNKYIIFDENGYIVKISKDKDAENSFTFQDYVNMFTENGKKKYFKYFFLDESKLLKRKLYLNNDKALAFSYNGHFETSFNDKQIFSLGGTTDFIGDILSEEGKEVYNKMMNLYTFNNDMSVDCIANYLNVESILNLQLEISNDKVYVADGSNNRCFTVKNKDGEKIIIFSFNQKRKIDFNYRDLIDCFGKNIVQKSLESELSQDLFNDVLKLIEIENLDINKMKLYCYYDKEKNRYYIKITIGDISITVDRNTKKLVTFDKIKFNTLTQTICKDYKERFSMLQTEEINPIVTINKIEEKEKGEKKEEVEVINLNFDKERTRTISFDGWDEETKKFEKIKIQSLSLEELEKCVEYDNLKNLLKPLNIDMIESKDKKKTNISLDEKKVITINIGTDNSISFDTKQNKITNIQGKYEKDFLKGLFKDYSEDQLLGQLGISGFKFAYRDGAPRNARLIFDKNTSKVAICPDYDNNEKILNVIFDRKKQEIVGFTEGHTDVLKNDNGMSVDLSQLKSMLSDKIWENFFATTLHCPKEAKDLIQEIQYSRSENDTSGNIKWLTFSRYHPDMTFDNNGKLIDLYGTCIFGDLKKTGMLYNITGHAEDMNWKQKLDRDNFDKYDECEDIKYTQEKIKETEKLIEKKKAEMNSMSKEKEEDIEKMKKKIEADRKKINEIENKRKEDFNKKKQIDNNGKRKSSFAELKMLKFKQYFIDPSKGGDYLDDFVITLGDKPYVSNDEKFMYVDGRYSIKKMNEDGTIACSISFEGSRNDDFTRAGTDLEGSLESEFLNKLPKTSRDEIKNKLYWEFNIKTDVFNFNESTNYEKNPVTDLYVEKGIGRFCGEETLTIYFGGSKDSFIKISSPFKIKEVKNVSLKKLKEMFDLKINNAKNAIQMIENKIKNKDENVSDDNYNIVYYSTNKDEIKFEPIESKSKDSLEEKRQTRETENSTILNKLQSIKDKNNKFIEFLNTILEILSKMFGQNNNNEALNTLIDDLMTQLSLVSDDQIWSNDKTLKEKAILHLNQLTKKESQQINKDLSKHLKNAVLAKRNFDIISSLLSDQLKLSNNDENKNNTEETKKKNIKIYTEILKKYEEKYYNATNNVNMLLFPADNRNILPKDINFDDDIEKTIESICSDSNDDKDLSEILSGMIQAEQEKIEKDKKIREEQIKKFEDQAKKENKKEQIEKWKTFAVDEEDEKSGEIKECELTKLKKEYRNKLLQQEINNEIEKELNEFYEKQRDDMLKNNEKFKQLRDKESVKNKQFNSNTINNEIDGQLKKKVEDRRREIESRITKKVSTDDKINKKLDDVVFNWGKEEVKKKQREISTDFNIKIEKRKQELLRQFYKDNDNKKDETGKDNKDKIKKDEELSYTIKSEDENITETTIDSYEQNIITQTLIQVVSNKQNSIIKDILDNKAKSINFTEKLKNILKTNKSIKIEKENNQTGGVQQI